MAAVSGVSSYPTPPGNRPMPRALPRLAATILIASLPAACASTPHDHAASIVHAEPAGSLPSWRVGPNRDAILAFIDRTTDPTSPDFVPVSDRLAVFDNDGTLWCEKPGYVQLAFAIDRVRALAPEHPEWRTQEPFRAAIEGDVAGIAATGEHGLLELVMASHAGMDSEEFAAAVEAWARDARHPTLGRRYVECVYAPMIELIALLRDRGFTVAICSGGGTDFMRVLSKDLYGIAPEDVVGSRIELAYVSDGGEPRIERRPAVDFINDKSGKPVGIFERFGRRPILAVGNSDGDFDMLEWTTSGDGPRLGVLLHHTDAAREFAYDRDSSVGRLDRGLDEGPERGWVIVDMQADWSTVFP